MSTHSPPQRTPNQARGCLLICSQSCLHLRGSLFPVEGPPPQFLPRSTLLASLWPVRSLTGPSQGSFQGPAVQNLRCTSSLGLFLDPFCGNLGGWTRRSPVHTIQPESVTNPDPKAWERITSYPPSQDCSPPELCLSDPPSQWVSVSFKPPGQGHVSFILFRAGPIFGIIIHLHGRRFVFSAKCGHCL